MTYPTKPLISGYTTLRNASEMDYPFEESIKSLLPFCDEVVIYDSSDGTDDTLDRVQALDKEIKALGKTCVSHHAKLDWKAPNHGILDGQAKANARALCHGTFLWQIDSDEIVHEAHAQKILDFVTKSRYLQDFPLMALPVIEYWGSSGKIRIDVNLWKWRLSKNDPNITHGIPKSLRKYVNGLLYASPGTDTCDYIYKHSLDYVPCANYVTLQIDQIRQIAVKDPKAAVIIERFVNRSLEELPGVFHYSWWSIERKIKQYKSFWGKFWKAMYNEDRDPKDNPFFQNTAWEDVTDEMIVQKAAELEAGTCGHIFHKPWDGSCTNGIHINMDHPTIIKPWLDRTKVG